MLFGSADLLNSLIKDDLIDEYRIMVFPVVLGSGKRLFRDTTDVTHLVLVDTRTFESGVSVLTYRPADRVPSSTYVETFAGPKSSCDPGKRPRSAIRDDAGSWIDMTG